MQYKQNNIYFSIIICCYNSEKYLNETIESIIDQKYKYWEIILVNDGSNDSTEKIALKFATDRPKNLNVTSLQLTTF